MPQPLPLPDAAYIFQKTTVPLHLILQARDLAVAADNKLS